MKTARHSSPKQKFDDVATGSYNIFMSSQIKSVGIRELKNNLSSYLKEVKNGTRLLICDREQVVAQICSISGEDISLPIEKSSQIAKWVEEKIISVPSPGKKQQLSPSPVNLPDGTSLKLLEAEREDKK